MAQRFHREWMWPWGAGIVLALWLLWSLVSAGGWLFGLLALIGGIAVSLRVPEPR